MHVQMDLSTIGNLDVISTNHAFIERWERFIARDLGLFLVQITKIIRYVILLFRLTSDSAILSSINSLVGVSFSDVDSFSATQAFIATWENVIPYSEGTLNVRLCCQLSFNKTVCMFCMSAN